MPARNVPPMRTNQAAHNITKTQDIRIKSNRVLDCPVYQTGLEVRVLRLLPDFQCMDESLLGVPAVYLRTEIE